MTAPARNRRVVTSYAIENRTKGLLKYLNGLGYETTTPNSEHPHYIITSADGHSAKVPHMGAGRTAFELLLNSMQDTFGWNTVDTYKARMHALFSRNREKRDRLRETMEGWSPERVAELEARAQKMLDEHTMNLPVEMVDEQRAYDILLNHNLAARARGVGEGEDTTLDMFKDVQQVRQRSVSENRVDEIAREILAGRWELHHQGVALGMDNYLLDGQKRLWAVVRSGIPCPMVVACNVPDAGFHAMDNTEARNGTHVLDMLGVPNPARATGALRLLHFYDNFPQDRTRWYSYRLTNGQIRSDVLNHYLDIKESVQTGYRTSLSADTELTPSTLIAAHFIITRACKDVWPEAPIAEFFSSIADDEPHEYFHAAYPQRFAKQFPARQLNSWSRTWETRAVSRRRGKNDKSIQFLCMILSAWNDAVQGERWDRPQFHERHNTPSPYVRETP